MVEPEFRLHVIGNIAIDDRTRRKPQGGGCNSDPLPPLAGRVRANKPQPPLVRADVVDQVGALEFAASTTAAARQATQLPAFAPLLEELEVAGWSSHRRRLSGNFHDWSLLENRQLLVMVGQAVATQPNLAADPIEAALVAQGAWASIRSHAQHANDAGALLSLAARSLWPVTNAGLHAAVGVGLLDLDGGHSSVAMAGDCWALRIRAAGTEPITANQPMLGADSKFNYVGHTLQLSLRERLLLVADEPCTRPPKLAAQIATTFSRLDAESHRRMMAADAIALVRQSYERPGNEQVAAASIVAVRRR